MAYNPSHFVTALLSLCPSLVPRQDFEVTNDGTGPVISAWHSTTVVQPSQAAIEAVDTDALLAVSAIPQTVSPRQARLALLAAGLLDQVEAAVNAAGGATKVSWDFATQINREDPLIAAIGAAIPLTSDQIDTLFKYAATQ